MADTVVGRLPAFATRLLGERDEDRIPAIEATHPDYDSHVTDWRVLLDAFEGSGGFATGEYLWPYKNELPTDYGKRQQMARYHNYVETIVDLYVRHVFSRAPQRTTKDAQLEAWWENVDGAGTSIDAFMRVQAALALAAGHVGILMDQTRDEPTGPAKADQKARPFLSSFTAPAILDWRLQKHELAGVKLQEVVQVTDLAEDHPEGDEAHRFLLWDQEGWARFTHNGLLLEGDVPGLDLVPFEVLRPKPSILFAFMGRPLFSNANTVKALYNRMSEEDQVLRDQAFSLLTVEVDQDGDVEQARQQLGQEFGTQRAVCVRGKIKYESPDMKVPNEVRENIKQIIRELYRVAHMRYERDSLDAESAEAIRLQYSELNEMLQGLAAELMRVERQIARFYYAWTEATPEAADAAFERSDVSIAYAQDFFLDDLIDDLTAWIQAIQMGLGDTFTKRIKKRAVKRIDPEIPIEELKAVELEIDQMPADEALMADAATRLKASALDRLGAKVPGVRGAREDSLFA